MQMHKGNAQAITLLAALGVRPHYIATLDSATSQVRTLGRFLHGRPAPVLNLPPPLVDPLAKLFHTLPNWLLQELYTWNGWLDATPARQLQHVRQESVARWLVRNYPRRRFPAVFVGSSNGAATHLGAALGSPWLPQTMLTPVRRLGLSVDTPRPDVEWAREPVETVLTNNPDTRIHQMRDPGQDRLMLRTMAYFRLKRLRLGPVYEQFLERQLEPGGTIFLVECRRSWLATEISPGHIFQHGGEGDATAEEYSYGSKRVAAYLERQGSDRRAWDPPAPDGEHPEAEWGFAPELRADVERFARRHGFQVRRIIFEHPEDLSPLVAELYRWWYRRRGMPDDRLLVESFVHQQPYWALRHGLVPYWSIFSVEPSVARLERYLDTTDPYAEIFVNLFSHGVDSIGIAKGERWQAVLDRARREGRFLGVNPGRFPRDFGSAVRYYYKLKQLDGDYPLPDPLTLAQLDRFLADQGGRFAVRWAGGAQVEEEVGR
jgi:hypothetical protein